MNYLSQNIKHLRKSRGLTQESLAKKMGITRSLIGAYEEGRAEPKLQTVTYLCHFFNVSLDTLINKNLAPGGTPESYIDTCGQHLRVLPVTVDREGNELTTLVPVKASAGYVQGYGDPEFIENLPRFDLPLPELQRSRTYRLFQIKGESMLPIEEGSYIICEYLQDWNHIRNEQCYILVTLDEGILYKRVINNLKDENSLLLKSDNQKFAPYPIPKKQVLEIWKALGFISFNLPDGQHTIMEIDQLTEVVLQLKNEIAELKRKL